MKTRSCPPMQGCVSDRRGLTSSSHLMSPSFFPPATFALIHSSIHMELTVAGWFSERTLRMSWPNKGKKREDRQTKIGKWSHSCPLWSKVTECHKLNYVLVLELTEKCTCCMSTCSTRLFLHAATVILLYYTAFRISEPQVKCTWVMLSCKLGFSHLQFAYMSARTQAILK